MDFVPKVRIDVVVPSEMVREVVDAVINTAKTGKVGDGKILRSPE